MSGDLEIRHCRVLVAVHEHGSVGAAARALGLAQSTASETLLSLERVLGAPVTHRRPGREATLTAVAEALLPHAQSLIATSEQALAAVLGRAPAEIRLGTVESISSFLLPGPLSAFRREWPQVDVPITVGVCEDLRARVARSELDAALTIEGADAGEPGSDLAPVRLRLVVSPQNRLARTTVRRRDLEGRRFLLTDPDGAFNKLLRAWAEGAARPPRLESAGSIDGVKRAVRNSDAVGVLPDYAVAEELAAQTLVELGLDEPLPRIALRLTTLHSPAAGSPLETLIRELRAALRKPDRPPAPAV